MQDVTEQPDLTPPQLPILVGSDLDLNISPGLSNADGSDAECKSRWRQELSLRNVIRRTEGDAFRRLENLRAVVLLDGSVQPSQFSTAIQRSFVELPITPKNRLSDIWGSQVDMLGRAMGQQSLPCRLMIGASARKPIVSGLKSEARLTVEYDPSDFRGTGGVLCDLAEKYDEEAYLLVASAAQLLTESLRDIAIEAAETGGDVTIAANADGSPSNVMLISCKALRELPRIGFVDMKEQGLPLIAKKHRVTVMRRNRAFGMPIRNLREYLAALRAYDRLAAGEDPFEGPFAERWASRFSIVEAGAAVDSGAHLHDSVVLAGGIVEAGASVVRSVVCDGGVVRRHEQRVDALVTGELK